MGMVACSVGGVSAGGIFGAGSTGRSGILIVAFTAASAGNLRPADNFGCGICPENVVRAI
jgi:hypothetical protein